MRTFHTTLTDSDRAAGDRLVQVSIYGVFVSPLD